MAPGVHALVRANGEYSGGRPGRCPQSRAGAGPRGRAHPAARAGAGAGAACVFGFEVPVIATEPVLTHQVTAMGATAELMIVGGAGPALAEWAVLRLEQLEASWSRFRPESELCAVERHAGAGPVAASPELVDVIGRAISLWHVTDGRFDPTVRAALEAIGYDRTFREVARTGDAPVSAPPGAGAPAPSPGCGDLRVDRERATVTIPAGVALDLGGVGKGLAADLIATGLVERGAAGACVALGGDVRVAGLPAEGEMWQIRVEHPLDEARTLCTRTLDGDAIVTSTTRFRRWTRGGRRMHHIIDPSTGAPAEGSVTAVVAQADEAWWAEGVAKAALVAGVGPGIELLERLGIAAVVVTDDGALHHTAEWEAA